MTIPRSKLSKLIYILKYEYEQFKSCYPYEEPFIRVIVEKKWNENVIGRRGSKTVNNNQQRPNTRSRIRQKEGAIYVKKDLGQLNGRRKKPREDNEEVETAPINNINYEVLLNYSETLVRAEVEGDQIIQTPANNNTQLVNGLILIPEENTELSDAIRLINSSGVLLNTQGQSVLTESASILTTEEIDYKDEIFRLKESNAILKLKLDNIHDNMNQYASYQIKPITELVEYKIINTMNIGTMTEATDTKHVDQSCGTEEDNDDNKVTAANPDKVDTYTKMLNATTKNIRKTAEEWLHQYYKTRLKIMDLNNVMIELINNKVPENARKKLLLSLSVYGTLDTVKEFILSTYTA
jgi:hypothetical protein